MPSFDLANDIFTGGQMTDLPEYTGDVFDGTELFEIVSPGTAADGVNYKITSAQIAAGIASISGNTVILGNGDNITALDPYVVLALDSRIYINKTGPEPTFITFGNVAAHFVDTLIADVAGTTDALPNGVTISFSGGQTADGNASVTIQNAYGGWNFRPVRALSRWSLGSK